MHDSLDNNSLSLHASAALVALAARWIGNGAVALAALAPEAPADTPGASLAKVRLGVLTTLGEGMVAGEDAGLIGLATGVEALSTGDAAMALLAVAAPGEGRAAAADAPP